MAQKRGWKDWVKGIALYGMAPNGDLILIRTDEQGNLTVNLIPHHTTHEAGGSDEIDVTGLKGVLAELQYGKWYVYDTRANFPATAEVGALAYATDEEVLYRWDGSSWVAVLGMGKWKYYGPKSGFPGSASEGSLAYATDEETLYRWNGSAWVKVLTLSHTQLTNVGPDDHHPQIHATSHRPGGSDPLPTGTPSTLTEGATAAEGSSTEFARADHVHGTPSEWTPSAHGNERHSPDFLAVDGSNVMEGPLLGKTDDNVVREFGRLGCSISGYDNRGAGYILPGAWDRLLFLTKKGGSVSATVPPASGDLDNMFDGTGSKVHWLASDLPVTITITLETTYSYCRDFFIHFYPNYAPKEFKVRFKDSSGAVLREVWETNWDPGDHLFVLAGGNYDLYGTKTIEIELIQAKDGYSYAHIFEVIWLYPRGTTVVEPALYRGGSSMYGDIDMNGNDVTDVGLVDGVDVSSHASRHKSGGADEIRVGELAGVYGGMQSVFSGTAPTLWTDLDLSPYVGSRYTLVLLRVREMSGAVNNVVFRANDDSSDTDLYVDQYPAANKTRLNAYNAGYVILRTDQYGKVEWKAENANSVDIYLMAAISLE